MDYKLKLLKKAFILFLLLSFTNTYLLIAKVNYSIQLATAKKNANGLKFMQTQADRLSLTLKRDVRIVAGEKFYILYALFVDSKLDAMMSLIEYQNYFEDALIRKHDPMAVKLIRDYSKGYSLETLETEIKEIKINKTEAKKAKIQKKKKARESYAREIEEKKRVKNNSEKNLFFTNNMLVGRTIFIIYLDRQRDGGALVAMNLNKDYSMKFEVAVGREDAGVGKYFIDFQGRFYIYLDEADRYGSYYTLKKQTPEYLIAQAWENGVKDSNEIRFYYNFDKAMYYLNSL